MLLSLAAIACSQENAFDCPGLICFQPGVSVSLETKSGMSGTSFPTDNDIIVSAKYRPDSGPESIWFDRVKFSSDAGVWSADKYWPKSGSMSFMAYSAPGLDFPSEPEAGDGLNYWDMTLPSDYSSRQTDILFSGCRVMVTPASTSSPLPLTFKHAMAQLIFVAESNSAWDAVRDRGIVIDEICLNNVYMDGNIRLYDSGYVEYDTASSSGAIERLAVPCSGDYQVPGISTRDVQGIGGYGLLVPPQAGTSFTVTYTIHDGILSKQKTLEYNVSEQWEANEKYVYSLAFDGEALLLELKPRYLKITSAEPNILTVTQYMYNAPDAPYLEYSLDGENWQQVPFATYIYSHSGNYGWKPKLNFRYQSFSIDYFLRNNYISPTAPYLLYFDSVIYLRGENPNGLAYIETNQSGYKTAYLTQLWFKNYNCEIQIEGDLTSLLSYTHMITEIPDNPLCFAQLLGGDTVTSFHNITKVPDLDVDVINSVGCLYQAYRNLNLQSAPELPAQTLAESCYEETFSGCRTLTVAPELPAMNLANRCYFNMFKNSSVATPPLILPASILRPGCYNGMFAGSQVTITPELPASEAAEGCYSSMFENCIYLLETRNIAMQTYGSGKSNQRMFYGCNSLYTVRAYTVPEKGTIMGNEMEWMEGVPERGTYILTSPAAPSASYISERRNSSGIPETWTVIHEASGQRY